MLPPPCSQHARTVHPPRQPVEAANYPAVQTLDTQLVIRAAGALAGFMFRSSFAPVLRLPAALRGVGDAALQAPSEDGSGSDRSAGVLRLHRHRGPEQRRRAVAVPLGTGVDQVRSGLWPPANCITVFELPWWISNGILDNIDLSGACFVACSNRGLPPDSFLSARNRPVFMLDDGECSCRCVRIEWSCMWSLPAF